MYHDFVIQLKNAAMARKKDITVPYANLNKAIAKALIKEGFLESAKEETVDGKRLLNIRLRYQSRKPAITDLILLSKPSLRKYVGAVEIGKIQGRSSVAIISTNIGVLSGKEAIKKGAGGELLFKIW
ncbi:MAG TPA: 30S ribosomal protein S8 [Candidatus Saccharimonadales bacterium]|nr:30S ribosomal protein S8 [Candidatus Saccharimonadales bacterium]